MLLCDIVLNFRTTFMREDGEMEENPKPVSLEGVRARVRVRVRVRLRLRLRVRVRVRVDDG